MLQYPIDINCDMGESYGNYQIGNDEALMPYITSASIACGFHAGDPLHIEQTIKKALSFGITIGAHPSYPDLAGFGRRKMHIKKEELRAIIKYQVAAIKGITESLGGQLAYIKPHGALYNSAATNEEEAMALFDVIRAFNANLKLMGLAGSPIEKWALQQKIPFIAEAFADRKYTAQGTLQSRTIDGAVIVDPVDANAQVVSIYKKKEVLASDGTVVPINAQSVCIHGDNPKALAILELIKREYSTL